MTVSIIRLEAELKKYNKQKNFSKALGLSSQPPAIAQLKQLINEHTHTSRPEASWSDVLGCFLGENLNRTIHTANFFNKKTAPCELFDRLTELCLNHKASKEDSILSALNILYATRNEGTWSDTNLEILGEASRMEDQDQNTLLRIAIRMSEKDQTPEDNTAETLARARAAVEARGDTASMQYLNQFPPK